MQDVEPQRSSSAHLSHSSNILPTRIICPPNKVVRDKSWAHLVAGAGGGITTAVLTSPLDVLRTRFQTDFYQSQLSALRAHTKSNSLLSSSTRHVRETFQILFSIGRFEGWRGFFRGLGPSLTGVVPATAIKFYTYGNCKQYISKTMDLGPGSMVVHAISAATAGIVTGTITNPIWLVKTRLQLDKSRVKQIGDASARRYRNSLDCVRQVLQQEGLKGLFRGLSASYLGVVETTLHLTLYEQMRLFVRPQSMDKGLEESTWGQLNNWLRMSAAGGVSKLLTVLVAYPHEVVRTRLRQAPLDNGLLKYTSLVQCFRIVVKEEGIIGLYGGLTAHLLRSVPSAAITLGVYEVVLRLFHVP